ncbi:acyl-coA-binding protein ACBP [Flammeovirgaceae bacterium 311]|nr:acyl-coA-binding protein ACBP [Flammeovirgaceae bacterium 311]
MVTDQEFQQAVSQSQQLSKRPSNEELLKLYALYKQATEGDVKGERPGGFDFKAMAKYGAWEEQKGKSAEQAKQEYVALVSGLQQRLG